MALLKPQLEELRKDHCSVEEWVNNTQSTTDFTADVIQHQIQECQVGVKA